MASRENRRRRQLFAAALLCSVVYTGAAAAQVYRCDTGGVVSYADRPCTTGTQSTVGAKASPTLEQITAARSRLQTALDARPGKPARTPQPTADCPRAAEVVQIIALDATWVPPAASGSVDVATK
jgi:hypothetical protein